MAKVNELELEPAPLESLGPTCGDMKRAIQRFEMVMRSRMEVQDKLAERIKYGINGGMVILSLIAISILLILMIMATQVKRISEVVMSMNHHFTEVSQKMRDVSDVMISMQTQVQSMQPISESVVLMSQDVVQMNQQVGLMSDQIGLMKEHMGAIQSQITEIAATTVRVDSEVLRLNGEVGRMAQPARTINKFFPMP